MRFRSLLVLWWVCAIRGSAQINSEQAKTSRGFHSRPIIDIKTPHGDPSERASVPKCRRPSAPSLPVSQSYSTMLRGQFPKPTVTSTETGYKNKKYPWIEMMIGRTNDQEDPPDLTDRLAKCKWHRKRRRKCCSKLNKFKRLRDGRRTGSLLTPIKFNYGKKNATDLLVLSTVESPPLIPVRKSMVNFTDERRHLKIESSPLKPHDRPNVTLTLGDFPEARVNAMATTAEPMKMIISDSIDEIHHEEGDQPCKKCEQAKPCLTKECKMKRKKKITTMDMLSKNFFTNNELLD